MKSLVTLEGTLEPINQIQNQIIRLRYCLKMNLRRVRRPVGLLALSNSCSRSTRDSERRRTTTHTGSMTTHSITSERRGEMHQVPRELPSTGKDENIQTE